MNENTFSVDSGVITINGNIIRCVTDYKVGSIPGFRGRVHVDLGFDAIMQNANLVPKENVPVEIHIPVIIDGERVEDVVLRQVFPDDENRLSRLELLELALSGTEKEISDRKTKLISAHGKHLGEQCARLEEILDKRRQIKEELDALTNKED